MTTDADTPIESELEQVYGLLMAEQTKVASYKAGNTELLELLMMLHAGDHTKVLHRGRDILLGAGLLNVDLTLNWPALEARKRPVTWEQAVRECVTDPAEVERLLALDDDAPMGDPDEHDGQ